MAEFVHLHLHSEGSLLDGMCRTKALLQRATQEKMPAVAITDHGVMYKCIEFYRAAQESGVKPILGCEIYVTPGSRFDRTGRGGGGSNYYHLILLAKNFEGYKNLMRLVSRGHLEGFYYKPRVDRETLAEFSEGLVCLSACLGAEVPQLIVHEKLEEARRAAEEHREIFGRENYFLELQDHGIDDQYRVNEALLDLSKKLDIPMVATNDVHYVCPEDHHAHDLLLCIQTGAAVTDQKRFKFESSQFYLATAEEMDRKLGHIPGALTNTLRIAEMCNLDLQFDQVSLPEFPVPEGSTPDSYLKDLCVSALPTRFNPVNDDHIRRLDYELSVINPKGFASYFLIVADFVRHAQERGISCRARGSAAGSIVAYLLGITSVDPLRYNLMFERFLNPDRVEMPDIDLDFADIRREEMIDYAIERYGKDHVAQIGTLGTLGARAAIRDAGRALNVPLPEVDRIAKLISGLSPSIDDCLQGIPEMQQLYDGSPEIKTLIDRARTVEGVVRTSGIHAAGVVISRDPLTDCVPLQRAGEVKVMRDGVEVTETRPCTQYDMESVSKIGLLKVDFLGLRNLTVVDNCLELISKRRGEVIDIDRIPEDDTATFEMLSEGHGVGVFQLESSGMRQMVRQLKPRIFDDLVPVVALYRPGPLQSGMVDQFIECRHGRRSVTYLDDQLQPILKDTYGVMLYQEQIMQISMQVGGFQPGDAEKLRKAMSKKIHDLMAKFRDKFVGGAMERGVKRDIAGTIYDQMAAFAAYGFNKAHSAAYGALCYQTAYLKANYSVEYLSALLTSLMENKDRLAATMEECRRMSVDVRPPDINRSAVNFEPEPGADRAIRFGLAAIKGLSSTAIDGILKVREQEGPFESIFDFCERTHEVTAVNKGSLEALIKAGAFQEITPNRRQLMDNLDVAMSLRQQARRNAQSGQVTLFGLLGAAADSVAPKVQYPQLRPVEEYKPQELLGFEKDLLGLYVSNHPLHAYRKAFRKAGAAATNELKQYSERDAVTIGGLVCEFRRHQTRKGDPMMFVMLEDLTGRIDVVVFKEALEKHGELIEKDRVILVRGKVSIRAGAGGRGRKSGSDKAAAESEETDDREFSVLADEITAADATLSDLDPWADIQDDPVESWGLSDGSLVEIDPTLDGDETVVPDLNWSAPRLFNDPPAAAKKPAAREKSARITPEPGGTPNAAAEPEKPSIIPEAPPIPESPAAAPSKATAAPATGGHIRLDLPTEEVPGWEPAASAPRAPAPTASTPSAPAPPAPESATGGGAALISDDDEIPDDVTTIRDIYGALPKKGEKVVLYPPAGESIVDSPAPRHKAPQTINPTPNGSTNGSGAAPAIIKVLRVRLTPETSTRPVMEEIAAILSRYAGGPHPVELTVETPAGRRKLRSHNGASVQRSPELVRALRERCGSQNVDVTA